MNCSFCDKEIGKKIAVATDKACICCNCVVSFMEIIGNKLTTEMAEMEELNKLEEE